MFWRVLSKISLHIHAVFNPFPHDKILDQTKLEAFADDKLNVTKMIISVFDRVEKIVGKGEIACTSNFSFSHYVFKRLLSQRRQKVSLCGNGLIHAVHYPLLYHFAEPHSSVGSVVDLRTGGHWFDPRLD